MKKASILVLMAVVLFACSGNGDTMLLSGNVAGLKKGWLYLQRVDDSLLVNVDSLEIRGDGSFSFEKEIDHPELFYLYLQKADNNDYNDRIAFFGEKGKISIHTKWDQFENKAKINGSKNHTVFSEYKDMMSNFNKRSIALAQLLFAEKDSLKIDSLKVLVDRNYVNSYRYLLNFALSHPTSYVTPYIAVTDGSEANPIYLDSIYNGLPDSISQSSYGKRLARLVEQSARN